MSFLDRGRCFGRAERACGRPTSDSSVVSAPLCHPFRFTTVLALVSEQSVPAVMQRPKPIEGGDCRTSEAQQEAKEHALERQEYAQTVETLDLLLAYNPMSI